MFVHWAQIYGSMCTISGLNWVSWDVSDSGPISYNYHSVMPTNLRTINLAVLLLG